MKLISKFQTPVPSELQTQTLVRFLRLPPLNSETRSMHMQCLDAAFDEYTPELVDGFFYCREHIAPLIAEPLGSVFKEGALSLYAAQVVGFLHKSRIAGIDSDSATKMLIAVACRISELFFSVMCSNFADGVSHKHMRLKELGLSCLNSERHGQSNMAHMISYSLVHGAWDILGLLKLPTNSFAPFFMNMMSIRCAQYSLMITDAECIAHNMLTSKDQAAFYLGAPTAVHNKGTTHFAYEH